MVARNNPRNVSPPQAKPELVQGKAGIRRCPVRNAWCKWQANAAGANVLVCVESDWGQYRRPGYLSSDRAEPCSNGHRMAWMKRKAGKMEIFICCFPIQRLSRRCGQRVVSGELQGFLKRDTGIPRPAVNEVKTSLLLALYKLGVNGGQRPDILQTAGEIAGLTAGQVDGALQRSIKSGHVTKSAKREWLPISGTGQRYYLSHRGLAFLIYMYNGEHVLQEWAAQVLTETNGHHGADIELLTWPSPVPA